MQEKSFQFHPNQRELPENHQKHRFFMHDGYNLLMWVIRDYHSLCVWCPAQNVIIIWDWFAEEASHRYHIKKILWAAFSLNWIFFWVGWLTEWELLKKTLKKNCGIGYLNARRKWPTSEIIWIIWLISCLKSVYFFIDRSNNETKSIFHGRRNWKIEATFSSTQFPRKSSHLLYFLPR